MAKLRAVYYINQFYAGFGGEEAAGMGLSIITDEMKGPAIGVAKALEGQLEIVKILACGDNFINTDSSFDSIKEQLKQEICDAKADVFIAGPAFNAGRYGVACAKMCDFAKKQCGLPSVTAMWRENPAIGMFVRDNYILPTGETATSMRKAIDPLANFALKLAKKEKIGPARKEGYFPTGYRYNEYHEKSAADRVVDMLIEKLNGRPYRSEIEKRDFEQVPAANAIADLSSTQIGLFTTGGLVPVGNPDKLKQAFSVDYGSYDINGLNELKAGVYESIHGGYDTTAASADPHRLIPLDTMRALVAEGKIGGLFERFGATCGVGTNVENSKEIGRKLAAQFKNAGITAAILTST